MSALFPLPSPSIAIGEGGTPEGVTDEVLPPHHRIAVK